MSRVLGSCVLVLLAIAARGDERGTELLRYECSSRLGRRDVTLFANGTVRLRQGSAEEPRMYLAELAPEELTSWLDLLGRTDATDNQPDHGWAHAVEGPWVERCKVVLALDGRPVESYDFAGFDAPPLRIAQLVHLAEELARRTRPELLTRRLPDDYRPVRGHVLQNAEGQCFRVKGFTGDLQGVELEGVDQPVTLFVSRENLLRFFFSFSEPEPR